MSEQHQNKEAILSAIREFLQATTYDLGDDAADLGDDAAKMAEATSRIPLTNLQVWERVIRWEICNASPIPQENFLTQPITLLHWVNLCNGDGFKREEALRHLSGAAPNRFFLALAVRRLNDWVPQVRAAARTKLPEIVKASDPAQVVDVLCDILPDLYSWGRLEHSDRQVLLKFTVLEQVYKILKEKIISAPAGPISSLLSQVGRIESWDRDLDEIAKSAIQPAVRAKAYRFLLEGKMIWIEGRRWEWTDVRYCEGRLKTVTAERTLSVASPFLETLKSAAADRSPMVRRVAAETLVRERDTLGIEAIRLAKQFVADAYPSIAERGQFTLDRLAERKMIGE